MGKKIDISSHVETINEESEELAKASQRLAANRNGKVVKLEEPENDSVVTSLAKEAPKRKSQATQQTVRKQDDPWVGMSSKIRLSTQKRLHELSKRRELAGLEPFQKKDLIEIGLQHVFDNFEMPK